MADGNSSLNDTVTSAYEVQWTDIVLGIFLFTIVVTTIVGNSFVLIAIYQDKRLRTSFNYYIVNLAITDILVAVTAMAFFTIDNILKYWPFGEFMCGVWIFFDYGMTFVSVFTLLVISVDRFWSVTWSMHYKVHHTKKKVFIFILSIWVFMVILWLPPFILDRIKNSAPRFCKWEPSDNPEFVVVIAVLGHHGSCFILLFCYVRVFYMLRKRSKIKIGNKSEPPKSRGFETSVKPSTSLTKQQNNEADAANGDKKAIWKTDNSKTSFRPGARAQVAPISSPLPSKQIEASRASSDSDHHQVTNTKDRDGARYERKEAKVFKTLTYIIVGYILCWVPFHIVFDISAVAPQLVPEKVYIATFWLAYLNSTINPFLYNFSSPEFKNAFKKILYSCCRR